MSPYPPGEVRRLFNRVAGRYDFFNHFFSLGRDILWRELAARVLAPRAPGPILDLACGTLDLTTALARRYPDRLIAGCDFSIGMIRQGRPKLAQGGFRAELVCGDGTRLPFDDGTFAAATIGFGIRQITDRAGCLGEFHRVLKPGGRIGVLELGLPRDAFIRLYLPYLMKAMPLVSRALGGEAPVYSYLGETIVDFPKPEQFLGLMAQCGFSARAIPLNRGIVYLFLGNRV